MADADEEDEDEEEEEEWELAADVAFRLRDPEVGRISSCEECEEEEEEEGESDSPVGLTNSTVIPPRVDTLPAAAAATVVSFFGFESAPTLVPLAAECLSVD